ncbi:hypothetical protein V5799_008907 [Amblyomma americanum]|uniref:Fucosyltransferase n=1 Tax=Amblyomma americanum TaxID=6943 RepID=A0AAQ4FC48_AMBAM
MFMVLVSCAVLLAFQVKLAAHRQAAVPPWMRQPVPSELRNNQARGGQQDGRESRTERAQRIMERQIFRHNVVPVVMGASREEYRAAAPHHSYIHVEDFRSPKELAEYLLLLSRNRTLYNEYFRWKGTGEFVNTYFWCRLCALLHAPPRPHQRRSEDVYRWWHTGTCRAGYEPPLPPAIALASRRRA